MTETQTIYARRLLTAAQATALVGERIPETLSPSFKSPKDGDCIRIVDEETRELIGIVTRLDAPVVSELRTIVTGMRVNGSSGRSSSKLENAGAAKTFGWMPKRVFRRRESCAPGELAVSNATAQAFLSKLGGALGTQFRTLAPEIAAHDIDIISAIHSGWLMEEQALWTSGVVNRTSQLPYHRDSTNFPTWSAMPTIRYRMRGGHLHLPEYDLVFPCGDGDVSWFCGKELVHGVTPMWTKGDDAYRYSVVYYALRGMKDCRTVAEETAESAVRRTARELGIADAARAALAASRA